jgi:hypothetical protein
LSEAAVNTEINQAYTKLKTILAQKKCRITSENPSTTITAVQGSIWGTNAKTAQKNLTFHLSQNGNETQVSNIARLTSAYVNLTLAGVIFSVALLFVCVWIALDLQSSTGVWGWLAQTNDHFDIFKAEVFMRLSWMLVAFLAFSFAVEGYIIARVRAGIELFGQEVVKELRADVGRLRQPS